MFLGNPHLLQRNLHSDLNTLLKNVKVREDQHLNILEYNRNLLAKLAEIQSSSFIIEQANKHKAFLLQFQEPSAIIEEEHAAMLEKYVCTTSTEASISKLMGRVIVRIIEICQSSLEKTKCMDGSLVEQFGTFKDSLLESILEGCKINIQIAFELSINYIEAKYNKETNRLKAIIQIIAKGNFDSLRDLYIESKPFPKREPVYHQKIGPVDTLIEKEVANKESITREQQTLKSIDSSKKKKAKIAKQLITNMYSTMDLAKQHFIEDFGYNPNPQEKRKRLYEEILSRNKFNQEQIKQFESKRSDFELKVRQFKLMMERESTKIQKALVFNEQKMGELSLQRKIEHKLSTEHDTVYESIHKMANEETETESKKSTIPERIQKVAFKRQMRHIKSRSPRFTKQISFSAMHTPQEGFQHIRFDVKNEQIFSRSNRARLPQLTGKSSLDGRYEYKNSLSGRQKKERQQKKTAIMRNVEIGANSFNLTNSYCFQNRNAKKSPRDRCSPNEPLFEIGSGVGFEYTFYARKKINGNFAMKNVHF